MGKKIKGRCVIGIDIGGTFTDAVLFDADTGKIYSSKVPTTNKDLSIGFITALERVLGLSKLATEDVHRVFHATTVLTNDILQHKIPKTGLITNKGFRDVVAIGNQQRPYLYDLQQEKPKPLIKRHCKLEVDCRINFKGEIVKDLEVEDVMSAVAKFKRYEIRTIAICYLHSYMNPVHEQKTAEILRKELPNVYISLSSEICPQIREFPRTSTVIINACTKPIMVEYINNIETSLRERGITADLFIMEQSGGMMTSQIAKKMSAAAVESGPAAGVIISAYLGKLMGYKDVISFDMGGTTAKAGLIEKGMPKITTDYEVAGTAQAGRYLPGSGYPLILPVIDLVEVGAGGGSIAWVDSGGALRVGPKSAGADPGPACYGIGGMEATVTDAYLLMGVINPEYFLGGEMKLDVKASENAVNNIACSLGMNPLEASWGIAEVSNSNMLRALRLVSVIRGYDPRDFVMVVFGGAGPMVAGKIAEELKIQTVLVPPDPGVISAQGLLVTDIRHDYVQTIMQPMDQLDLDKLNQIYRILEKKGRATLIEEKVHEGDMSFARSADMRYIGQGWEVNVPVPWMGELTENEAKQLDSLFHKEHTRIYGQSDPSVSNEIVSLRLVTIGRIEKPKFKKIGAGKESPEKALKTKRKVFLKEYSGAISCPIYDRYRLLSGNKIEGPAIVEEVSSTTVIYPRQIAEIDDYGNIIISWR